MNETYKDRLFQHFPTIAQLSPFVTWILLMSLLPATAWGYAIRSIVTAIVGLVMLAWHKTQNAKWSLRQITGKTWYWGLGVGLLVTILWIVPEGMTWYQRFCLWGGVHAQGPSPYDPTVCGWPLTLAKLIGSTFVIAPVEEVFFRSFLYRRLQSPDFQAIAHTQFDVSAFAWMVFLFALEHPPRFLAGAMAGGFYGFTYIKAGLGAAIVAHVLTNLLLALWVIHYGAWAFW